MEKTVSNEGFIKNFYYLGPTFFPELQQYYVYNTVKTNFLSPPPSFNLYATLILSW